MKTIQNFFAERAIWSDQINIYFRQLTESFDGRKTVSFAETATLRTVTENEVGTHTPPFLRLNEDAAQQLIDELWRVGFRPKEGTGSAGSLAATERHLEDMRALVFKTPPITKK